MFDGEQDIYKLNEKLEKLKLQNNQLPSGLGNSFMKLRLQDDSNPPSNYNSDTDEPRPRKRDPIARKKHKVELNEDFIATTKRSVVRDDFQTLCVLGRGA
jgi:hypothetical protein